MTLSFWVILSCVFHFKERWHPISSGLSLPNAINKFMASSLGIRHVGPMYSRLTLWKMDGLREIWRETPNGPFVFMWFFPQFPADFLLNKPVEHVECVRCYPGEIRPEEFQHLPVVTRWSGNDARRWKSTCKGADGREDGHLKQEVFQFTIRPGNKITEAVIVFDYRIVLGLFYLISRFGSQWIWFIGSHISENSGSHRRRVATWLPFCGDFSWTWALPPQ